MMLNFNFLFLTLFIPSVLSTRLKSRATVKENVDLYYTITSLDKMLSVNYQQSIEFLNINSPYTTYFLVDGQKLRTSRLIDREEFCRIKLCENSLCHPCEINMDFVLKENGQPRDIISLILTVEDVNEFRPQFFESSTNDQAIQLNISEGVPVGHVLPIPSATDKDGEDDELIYRLDKTIKSPFDLVSFGSNQIALNVTEPLDRETRDFYELKLTVSDRGNLTTTVSIHISISDINDNVPTFDQQGPYSINISENALPSLTKPLLRIHAIDNDSGENGRVTYNFSPQVSELIRQTFQLNSQTGEFFLRHSLDYEQYKEYRIQITAQDSGPVSVPVYTAILINVEDENDNKPLMNIRTSEYFQFVNSTLYISEETPLNTLLMHILVQDFDSNLNGKIQCWIESVELKFNITNTITNMFGIYTAQIFDREKQSNYSFSIIVEDFGIKIRHRTIRQIHLIITDINDSSPKFSQLFYNLSILEEEEYKQSLIQFHANDDDLNENSEISYELISNEYQQFFYINNKTGELFLRKKLDREFQSEYNLTIRARDHGKYPSELFTDVICYIKILDKNEYKPEFEKESYLFSQIDETILVNSSIGFVKAIDRDDNLVIYTISSSDYFRINSSTGEIFVNKQLDYDTKQSCEKLFITAKDQDGLSSTCPIEICLQPINEYSPEIHFQSRLIHINIDNTSSIHINAFDRDYSPSSFISFQFEKSPKCDLTFLSNGTIYINKNEHCIGIIDLFVSINDNDQYPSSKITNETIRLIFYSNTISLQQILFKSNFKLFAMPSFIVIIIFILIIMIICSVVFIACRQRKQSSLNISTQLKINNDHSAFTEDHCLLNDGIIDMSTIKAQKSTVNISDTSSTYNDSCYGSSEMDVYHPHHHSGNNLTSKIILSSNEKFIILCKDNNTSNNEETNSSSSSSSPAGNNTDLITRCQLDKRTGITQQYHTQLKSSNKNLEFFRNDTEYRRILGSTTSFNCRNMTPLNEYYL